MAFLFPFFLENRVLRVFFGFSLYAKGVRFSFELQ